MELLEKKKQGKTHALMIHCKFWSDVNYTNTRSICAALVNA